MNGGQWVSVDQRRSLAVAALIADHPFPIPELNHYRMGKLMPCPGCCRWRGLPLNRLHGSREDHSQRKIASASPNLTADPAMKRLAVTSSERVPMLSMM